MAPGLAQDTGTGFPGHRDLPTSPAPQNPREDLLGTPPKKGVVGSKLCQIPQISVVLSMNPKAGIAPFNLG